MRIASRIATLILLLPSIGALRAAETRPTNVVLLIADDLGWNDVGFHNKEVRTPHIDKLAADGVRLERHYSYPICSATRAALLTGLSTSRTGVNNSSGLDLAYSIMPQSFKAAGYQTWICGKWHLGGPEDYQRSGPKYLPHNRGYDHFYGFLHGAIDYVTHIRKDVGKVDWQRNGKEVVEEGFTTDLLANEAVKLLKTRDRTKPVLLHVAFNAVHGPLSPPPGVDVARRDRRKMLVANVESMDAAIGRILKTIDDEGLRDDTLVVFLSDNGGQLDQGASNLPLRGEKGTVFEGGIHTPAAVRWPGVLKAGSTSRQVISVIDWFPTIAGAVGIPAKTGTPFDGRDLWPQLKSGATTPPRNLVIAQGGVAVLDGRWKLVSGSDQRGPKGGGGGGAGKKARPDAATKKAKRPPGEPNAQPMLFDIEADPNETRDLAALHPEVVKALAAQGKAMTDLNRNNRRK